MKGMTKKKILSVVDLIEKLGVGDSRKEIFSAIEERFRPAFVECVTAWLVGRMLPKVAVKLRHPVWTKELEPYFNYKRQIKGSVLQSRLRNVLFNADAWGGGNKITTFPWLRSYALALLPLSLPGKPVLSQIRAFQEVLRLITKYADPGVAALIPRAFIDSDNVDGIDPCISIQRSLDRASRLLRHVGICDLTVELSGPHTGLISLVPVPERWWFRKSWKDVVWWEYQTHKQGLVESVSIPLDHRVAKTYMREPNRIITLPFRRKYKARRNGSFSRSGIFGLPDSLDLIEYISFVSKALALLFGLHF